MKVLFACALLLGCGLLVNSCTNSPLQNSIEPETIAVTGKVNLADDVANNSGVLVWLEGLNIATRTDSAGEFELIIPPALRRTPSSGLNGVYKLYFFVANYTSSSVEVVIRNGLFEYGEAGLNNFGRVKQTVQLNQILEVNTEVLPPLAFEGSSSSVYVVLRMRAKFDSVRVIFPKSVGGLLGGLFFRNEATGRVHIDVPDLGADTREVFVVTEQQAERIGEFHIDGSNFRELILPQGHYEVVPFFFVEHQNLPLEMFEHIGISPEELTPTAAYLDMPFRREDGEFRVIRGFGN